MFEGIKEQLTKQLNGYKAPLRAAMTSYQEKIDNNKKMSELSSILNFAINTVLPNLKSQAEISLNQLIENSVKHLNLEIRNVCMSMPLELAKKKAEEFGKETETFRIKTLAEISKLREQEKKLVESIGKIQKKIIYIEKPSLLKRIFWPSRQRTNAASEKGRELIEFHGQLTMLRFNIHLSTLLVNCTQQVKKSLDFELIPEINNLLGRIDQCECILQPAHQRSSQELKPAKAFQIDLDTNRKITEVLTDRVTSKLIESLALELKPMLGNLTPQKFTNTLLSKTSELFKDLSDLTVFDRLKELYPSSTELGWQIQEWVEKQGSPYNPLNEKLLDKNPFYITVVGVPDRNALDEIAKTLEQRNIKGSHTVSLNPDNEKAIIFTTLHRIPAFALSAIDEWQRAAQMREQSGPFAVYPERRWKEYLPINPALSEVKIDNIILLGLCDDYIKHYGPGFYRLNGTKVHGIDNLRTILSTDSTMQNAILERWLNTYRNRGLVGVESQLMNSVVSIENDEKLSKMKNDLLERLTKSKQEDLNEERFRQILVAAS